MPVNVLNALNRLIPRIDCRNLSLKSFTFKSPTRKQRSKPGKRLKRQNMASGSGKGQKPLGSKSTLGENHRFPAFYACYLLKSVKTPRSSATYIGSTPHPPRRIRQHNGILSAGAWKTSRNRPWEMQMVVHGFASKLAALQFEWAWQHPHLSRFLRGVEGVGSGRSRSVRLGANVSVVQAMLRTHPYTTWPLHVKLFTREAVNCWVSALAAQGSDPAVPKKRGTKSKKLTEIPNTAELTGGLPPGMAVSVELEGVDGSGKDDALNERTKRNGPIEVTDESFTSAHLAKHTRLLAMKSVKLCSVCSDPIVLATSDPLTTSLCPVSHCTGVAHLKCLSKHFLNDSAQDRITTSDIIPRGGTCPSCSEYVLWGAVIKASYRRRTGGKFVAPDLEDEEDIKDDNVAEDDCNSPIRKPTKKSQTTRQPGAAKRAPKAKGKEKAKEVESGSEQEMFDLDAISGTDEEEESPARPMQTPKKRTIKAAAKPKATMSAHHEMAHRFGVNAAMKLQSIPLEPEGEYFDLNAVSGSSGEE
ncbi:hypothetical protein SCHPADRAFT_631328 [Schizopora paradoxa]|uniref:GIY-YIG domain-containing protein n=1 Tax=Schizopora paradoxa TaxID=27342 RepID=A0A0H2R7M1_9AGAM|nr:hypothetical protein SCHPADRAFT_631328 [Schizopora paradoxa]